MDGNRTFRARSVSFSSRMAWISRFSFIRRLEPDLNLALGKSQLAGQFDASTARQVAVELEVLLEFEGLEAGVRLSTSTALC